MISLVTTGTIVEVRHFLVPNYEVGTDRVFDFDLLASAACPEATMAATVADRLQVSLDGGLSYTPLSIDVESGVSLGPFTVGQRKSCRLKVNSASGGFDVSLVTLLIGSGT